MNALRFVDGDGNACERKASSVDSQTCTGPIMVKQRADAGCRKSRISFEIHPSLFFEDMAREIYGEDLDLCVGDFECSDVDEEFERILMAYSKKSLVE